MAFAIWIAALLSVGCSASPSQPDVLLITVDTLRADRLGSYGHRLDTTPNLDSLASRGVRFTDCTAQWPKTWPSIGSLMTGAYPKTTGLRIRPRFVPPSLTVLSEIFGRAGYRTGAVVANFNIGKTFGFDQGFDFFVESWQEKWRQEAPGREFRNRPGLVKRYTDAALVNEQAIEWLGSIPREEAFFLWLHYMDPHGPYVPPREYQSYFQDAYPPEPLPIERVLRYQWQFSEDGNELVKDLGFYKAQHDREIRYLDEQIGKLLGEIREIRSSQQMLVVVTADHGESLGEHGYYLEHGMLSYQPSAHVPAIIVMEGKVPAGRAIQEPVGLIDVARTLVELAGLETPSSFEGHSLTGLIEGRAKGAPEYVFMESGYDSERPQRTVRRDRWKLIQVTSPKDRAKMAGAPFELYDVRADPGELKNLASEFPETVEELSGVLARWSGGRPGPGEPAAQVDLDALDEESKELLRALGYLDSDG
jgi:arylsulfatase A-like enzyme